MLFPKNIGSSDRILRLVMALILFGLAWWQSSWILLGAALFVLFESLRGWCVFYQIMGKNSCSIKRK